ncbi:MULTISPECIES: adenosylcobinamide-phosphate synthase CbiB [unclassified Leisingera]|uniref:adenosylcobinamide-phosphate synthase CbiB n=1 Tax=unclassified Leisingera TaxID=2614906 RepID=UPI0003142556|nr:MULTISPECIES: adenosylcobinamide-phosphate synthase CbiB [unclassified Leisingera]KIC17890.1 cobalamin biosynthesis protein CobD [Leisingera sp. ANG-DT]KIC21762.1 cobalamin biosynthesis protein CobD [Leisingera sp. ANG-S3]KIC51512.1 cobalamin biosynthesis protein CobD [Leisingera sp. ANG-S]KID07837.1 cobalamin biosynthesis protein CobD [Leisingera sp. ANG1]
MTTAGMLAVALLLDAVLGEPKWLWSRLTHPAVLMGRLVGFLDRKLNTGPSRRLNGVLAAAALVLAGLIAGKLLALPGTLVEILVAAVLIAQRSLTEHVAAVAKGLRSSLEEGRQTVAMIVSRDTGAMTAPQAARSAIESGAENLSDGVIAPAFWFLIAGLPGLIIYKMVNTADSMIGYRNDRYRDFGWAAARLDDLLNLIPARLTGLMIAAAGGQLRHWRAIAGDARKHRSPNAGWPEAAMARALDTSLAGPRSYDGEMRDFAWVHAKGTKSASAETITRSVALLWQTWALALALTVAIAAVF